jgi:protein TonB
VSVSFRAPADRIPAEAKVTPPAYPFALRRAAVGGQVSFEWVVRADGTVSDIMVANAGDREFRTAALEAIRSWRFRPAQDDPGGSPRPLKLTGDCVFSIVDQ